ncbi:MAG: cytidylate kinase-like family protein [Porphyromonadaceae bacterium]|jgi:cytidylate kinase|nr:cytidylate kinase-like family protein [Porphyromonadaceae bacterium]
MSQNSPLVVTISRELGGGGAYIGHKLAEELDMYYADHDIITRTAEKLSVFLDDVAPHEERITSFWQNFWEKTGIHEFYSEAVGSFKPTTAKIYEAESEVIQQIAKDHSAVIIGRCGFHVLKDYPNLVSIYLHGSIDARAKRLMDVRNISELKAKTQITASDRERALYIKKFTNKNWTDVHNFDLCIDTGKIGFDNATEIILKYIKSRKI